MSRVVVTDRMPEGGLDPLVAAGHDVAVPDGRAALGHDELVAAAGDADAIVCTLTDRIDAEVLGAGAGRLRVVGNVAVGYDNVDVAAATALGIAVCNTPGVLDETTADLAFALILAAARLVSDAERDLRAGRWSAWRVTDYLGRDVHDAMLGIVGYGRIGRAVARRAAGFDMGVLHHTRTPTGEAGWVADLDELLERADIVTLHVPLTEATRHLIDARRLDLIGPDGVLVNTARGPVVDEEALAIALEAARIFAAGLDVYEHEPRVHPRLMAAPRTVLLPHIGSASLATRRAMTRLAATGVAEVLAGRRPPNLVTP